MFSNTYVLDFSENFPYNFPNLHLCLFYRSNKQLRVKSLAQGPNSGNVLVLGYKLMTFYLIVQYLNQWANTALTIPTHKTHFTTTTNQGGQKVIMCLPVGGWWKTADSTFTTHLDDLPFPHAHVYRVARVALTDRWETTCHPLSNFACNGSRRSYSIQTHNCFHW